MNRGNRFVAPAASGVMPVRVLGPRSTGVSEKVGPVLILTPWFPNRPGEREGQFVFDSAAALVRRGIAVHVMICRPYVPTSLALPMRRGARASNGGGRFAEFTSLEVVRYPAIPRAWSRPIANRLRDSWIRPMITRALQRSGAALLHAHTEQLAAVAASAAKQAGGARTLVTVHGLNTASPYFRSAPFRALLRQGLEVNDRVILVGEPLRSFYRELVGRDDHFVVVPNGVQLHADGLAAPILADPRRPVRLISVSNLVEGKGVDIALQALAHLRDGGFSEWTYTIVGDGRERSKLVALVAQLGLGERVYFLGEQPPGRIPRLLCDADIFVLPSYREAFGIAYLEAMAVGLVAIGVRGQGPEAFIEHGKTGFLVAPRDAQALAQCLLGIAKERVKARAIASVGAEHVRKNFSWDAHAQRLVEVYREVCS